MSLMPDFQRKLVQHSPPPVSAAAPTAHRLGVPTLFLPLLPLSLGISQHLGLVWGLVCTTDKVFPSPFFAAITDHCRVQIPAASGFDSAVCPSAPQTLWCTCQRALFTTGSGSEFQAADRLFCKRVRHLAFTYQLPDFTSRFFSLI